MSLVRQTRAALGVSAVVVLVGCASTDHDRQTVAPEFPAPAAPRSPCADALAGCSEAAGVYPLAGYDPSLPEDDLVPVARMLRDADVLGLGESAHGSAGFIGLKIRLSKHLIQHHGFRVVAWETSRVPARRLDDYVQTCKGDPTEAVQSLYAFWADVLTRDFAAWLCEWNRNHPADRVRVFGYDVQDPGSDRDEIAQYLSAVAPKQAAGLMSALASCERGQHGACKESVANIRKTVEQTAASDKTARATVLIALTSYQGWYDEILSEDYATSFEARDIAMASVFLQLRQLHFPERKALLWAHNIHVVKSHENVAESWVGGPIVTQGTELARQLGPDRYRAVAIIGYDVYLNRPEQRGHVTPSPSESSVEATLHELGHPALYLDLRNPTPGALPSGEAFELGAPGVEVHVPAANYDGLLYLDTSPMAERFD